MNKLQLNHLSKAQFFVFLLHAQLGLAILILPHILGKKVGHDGWISVILGIFIVQILVLLYYYIVNKYPDRTLFEITIELFGTGFGRAINFFIILYYLLYATYIVSKCSSILNLWIYYRTPAWVLIICFVFVCYYIVVGDIQIIGRFLVLSTVFIFMILFFLSWAAKDLHLLYILPVGEAGITKILEGTIDATTAFAGFETFLFIHSFTKASSRTKFKMASLSVWIIGILYLTSTLICFMYFPNSAKNIEHAVLYLLVPMQFTLMERIEVFFIAGWVIIMATSYMCFLFISCLGISQWRKREHHKKEVASLSIVIFILATLSQTFGNATFWKWVPIIQTYCTYTMILLIPLIVACFTAIKNRKTKDVMHNET